MCAVVGALLVSACSPVTVVNKLAPNSTHEKHSALPYGDDPRHLLDVYVPEEGAEQRPVVVFFYGGAWQRGEREDYLFVGEALASQGIVTVLPDYRVYPQVVFPGFVEDGATALTWVYRNIGQYGGDPCKVFVAGHSAGAHIAALLHFDGRYARDAGVTQARTAGMIGLAGPYDFLPLQSARLRKVFPASTRIESQPIHFVDGDEAPVLLLHGLDDDTVWLRNTRLMANRILERGGVAHTGYYDGVGHVRLVASLARPFRRATPARGDIANFVHRQAGAKSAGSCPAQGS